MANTQLDTPLLNGGQIRGNTITGGTVSGTTITGGTVSGTTITGSTITGNTIQGGVIRGARIEGVTGRFTGQLEISQLVGGNFYEAILADLEPTQQRKSEQVHRDRHVTFYQWQRKVRIDPMNGRRLIAVRIVAKNESKEIRWSNSYSGERENYSARYNNIRDFYAYTEHRGKHIDLLNNDTWVLPQDTPIVITIGYWVAEDLRNQYPKGKAFISTTLLSDNKMIHPL